MHGNITTQLIIAASEIQQHTDFATMQIAGQIASRCFITLKTTDRDIFAQLHHQSLANFFNRTRTIGHCHVRQGCNVFRIAVSHGFGNIPGKCHEIIIFGHKIRFAVHFNDRAGFTVSSDKCAHHTFGGHARRGLAGLGTALDTHLFFSNFHVAIRFNQGFFTFHHAQTRCLAQFFDHTCGNCCHT